MAEKLNAVLVLAAFGVLAGCAPRDEYPHQAVEAYQADKTLRDDLLQKCASHITSKVPFRTQADTDECRKVATADANVRFAAHEAREQQGWSNLAGVHARH